MIMQMKPKQTNSNKHKQEKNKLKKNLKFYAKYSGIAFQMAAIIFVGVFGGKKLDEYINLKYPVFTLVFSLLSVGFAIYFVIRDLMK